MSLAIFTTFVLSSSDNVLDPTKVFVTFSIINLLNQPIMQLARAVNLVGQAVITVGRISRFLLLEEKDPDAVTYQPGGGKTCDLN